MPIFEYLCEDCGSKFEKLVRGNSNGVHCPSCGHDHLKQEFSTFSAHANGGANGSPREMMGSCPSGMCQTPDLCGRN